MKKILIALLCLSLSVTVFCGCGSKDTATEITFPQDFSSVQLPQEPVPDARPSGHIPAASVPSPTDHSTADVPWIPLQNALQPGNPQGLGEWVFTNYSQCFSWRDSVGNLCSVSISLPAIAPVADFAVAYNEEIYAMGSAILEDILACRENGYSNTLLSASYEAYLREDILSILIIEETAYDVTYYTANSFDLEDREALSTAQLCGELLDMDYPTFLLTATAIVENDFVRRYGSYAETSDDGYASTDDYFATEPSPEQTLYSELLAAIPTDTGNMLNFGLFSGENGQIMLICNVPSLAGASYYPTVAPFDIRDAGFQYTPTEAEGYEWLFNLIGRTDGAYAEAYAAILMEAFLCDSEDFVRYAAKLSASHQESVVSFLSYSLSPENQERFTSECRELTSEADLTESEKNLTARIQAISSN